MNHMYRVEDETVMFINNLFNIGSYVDTPEVAT